VRMVVKLACPLGTGVAAEWVETEEQAVLVAELGCDFAQGYRFSEPLPHKGCQGYWGSDPHPANRGGKRQVERVLCGWGGSPLGRSAPMT